MPATSLSELFQLERWLEEGFRYGLASQNVIAFERVDCSRQSNTALTPRIEIKAIVGEVANHQKLIYADAAMTWDAWSGELEALIVTNRQAVEGTDTHYSLIGKLRACFMPVYIAKGNNRNPLAWWNQSIVSITDIREAGTDDSWSDDKDLDYTKIKFALLFNINSGAWPV